jgi:SagB-type dehydrogenase family enzyme
VNPSIQVRRSPHLVAYWTDEGFVIANYASGASVLADALASRVLDLCAAWTPIRALRKQLHGLGAAEVHDLVTSMLDARLLLRRGARLSRQERALAGWQHWNPAAGFFHFSTKNVPPPANRERAEQALRDEAAATGMPPKTKDYPGSPAVALPVPQTRGQFARVLLERRTWRSFADAPVSLDQVSTLLNLTWGVQQVAVSPGLGEIHLKTSPSSGARQPLEAYMLALTVDGLPPGLYHYRGDTHSLERIREGADRALIRRYIPGQWWYDSAAALFMMTAVFPRTQWRYRFPRAYRSVLLEAGHVCQTFCLVATWLNLAPFCTGRFADSFVEQELGVDGVTESFVYGGGIGTRPAGQRWAPWPADAARDHPLMGRASLPLTEDG